MSTAVKRACDACHRRKVKCDGINPCRNCSSAQLSCTYNAIPQKKGPKGSRAKVISELRETQRQSSLSAKIQNRMNAAAGAPGGPGVAAPAPSLAPTTGLLTNEMVKACIDFFFAYLYPSMPILSRQRVEQDAMSMDTTLDTYCLMTSLSAFVMLQPGMALPSAAADPYGPECMPGATIVTATLLLEETVRVRKAFDYQQSPTLYTLATNYFLFACYYGLDLQDKAWFNLREATTLVHLVRMNKEESYLAWDNIDATRRRRLYWLLFAAERAYALQHDRPLSLKASVNPPSPTDDPSDPFAAQLVGFCRLVSLFRPFDDAFADLWNKTRTACTPSYLAALQKQHSELLAALVAADPQFADPVRNQQWLQTLAWQLNLASGGNPSSASAGSDASAYQYPVMDVTREIIPMAASFSPQGSSDLLNAGLIEALLSVSNDLMDLLPLLPSSSNPFTPNPRDHLNQLATIIALLRIGEHRFTPLLLAKAHEILPRLANPMLQSPPETACEMDIFDGFGNAGMAQPPSLAMEEYKPRIPSSSGNTSSMQDVNSPFLSSPPILSPGMDFTSGLSPDFTPMSELVMHHPMVANTVQSVPSVVESNNHQQATPVQSQLKVPVQTPQPLPQSQLRQHNTQHIQIQQQSQQQQQQQQQQNRSQHQQYQQQHLGPTQPHQQHGPMAVLQTMGQNLSSDSQIRSPAGHVPSQVVGIPGVCQPGEQSQNVASVLGGQTFNSPMNGGMAPAIHGKGLIVRQQPPRSGSFGMGPQQIRTVGDFQALQHANSDLSSLNPLGMNNLGTEVDFSALR